MNQYEFFYINGIDDVIGTWTVVCVDDDAALSLARQSSQCAVSVEVWCGARFIWLVRPATDFTAPRVVPSGDRALEVLRRFREVWDRHPAMTTDSDDEVAMLSKVRRSH